MCSFPAVKYFGPLRRRKSRNRISGNKFRNPGPDVPCREYLPRLGRTCLGRITHPFRKCSVWREYLPFFCPLNNVAWFSPNIWWQKTSSHSGANEWSNCNKQMKVSTLHKIRVWDIYPHFPQKTTKCNYTVHASYDPLYDTCKSPQSALAFGNLHLNKLWFLEEKLVKTWIPIPMVETKNLVLDLLEVVGKKTKGWFTGGFPW